MNETMVRKQIYIPKQQDQILKRLARQRGVSQAEVIRQALEREVELSDAAAADQQKALDNLIQYAHMLRDRPEFQQGEAYRWNRQELYEEREKRWSEDAGLEE